MALLLVACRTVSGLFSMMNQLHRQLHRNAGVPQLLSGKDTAGV
jgi:hypothetical protein